MEVHLILFLASLTLIAGLVKGLTGFGFALVATVLLTLVVPPRDAITLMIIPIMVSNFYLIKEIKISKLVSCFKKFKYFLLSSYIGVIVGMLLINTLDQGILKIILGAVVIAYVAVKTKSINLKINFNQKTMLHQITLGGLSGAVFGSTNAGVPYVAYIDSLNLQKHTFVGLLSSLLFIASSVRIGLAYNLGFYQGGANIVISIGLILPTILGVYLGIKTRNRIDKELLEKIILVLLTLIGLNLLVG